MSYYASAPGHVYTEKNPDAARDFMKTKKVYFMCYSSWERQSTLKSGSYTPDRHYRKC